MSTPGITKIFSKLFAFDFMGKLIVNVKSWLHLNSICDGRGSHEMFPDGFSEITQEQLHLWNSFLLSLTSHLLDTPSQWNINIKSMTVSKEILILISWRQNMTSYLVLQYFTEFKLSRASNRIGNPIKSWILYLEAF